MKRRLRRLRPLLLGFLLGIVLYAGYLAWGLVP